MVMTVLLVALWRNSLVWIAELDRITTKVAILVSSAVQGPTRTGRGRQGARRVPPLYKGEAYWGQRARVNVPFYVALAHTLLVERFRVKNVHGESTKRTMAEPDVKTVAWGYLQYKMARCPSEIVVPKLRVLQGISLMF